MNFSENLFTPFSPNHDLMVLLTEAMLTAPTVIWQGKTLKPLRFMDQAVVLKATDNEIESLEGVEGMSSLIHLDISYNSLVDLNPLSMLVKLRELDLSNNYLTSLEALRPLTNLLRLDISGNRVHSLNGMENMKELVSFNCSDNELHFLEPLHHLENIQFLECSKNRILDLQAIKTHLHLEELDCSGNLISDLDPIAELTRLTMLNCADNQISTLEPIRHLINLESLNVSDNILLALPYFITGFRRLEDIDYTRNTDIVIPVQVLNFIENRFDPRVVYEDEQNVHDSEVQRSVNDSLRKLFEDKLEVTVFGMFQDVKIADPELVDYLNDLLRQKEIHTVLNVKMKDVLLYVWNRARHILDCRALFLQELRDLEDICFTGRVSRMLNVLTGFFPDIQVGIAVNAQRTALMHLAYQKHQTEEEAVHFLEKEMQERGEPPEVVEEWCKLLRDNY